jgi:hypothetical protein
MLSEILGAIEAAGLKIGFRCRNLGKCSLGQDISGDIVDCGIGDFVDEADVLVFAGNNARDYSRRVISGSTMASRPRRP